MSFFIILYGFGSIQNNIALKPFAERTRQSPRFGSIQNNIALKHLCEFSDEWQSFGSIQNNIALKPTI